MKILFVQKEGGIFGAERYQLNIIPELMNKGIEIEFLRLYTNYQGGKGGEFINRMNSLGVKTYEINIGRLIRPVNLYRINKIIKKGNYDLIHTHLIHADVHLALIKLFLNRKIKLVSTKHGYDNKFIAKNGFNPGKQGITMFYLMSKFSERMVNASFAITNSLRNLFLEVGISNSSKIGLIYYGFDFESPRDEWLIDQYKLFKKQLIIAGRLVLFKGHRFVIEALPDVLLQHPDAGLIIIGSGEQEDELKRMVSELKLDDKVVFMGYRSDILKWMYNSDIVMVPSVSEGFGIVLLEAFNCSKPVIAFNVPACNELIEDGRTGFLVAPYDIKQLSIKIAEVLNDPVKTNEVGKTARVTLISRFNLYRMVAETIEFYRKILNS